MTRGSQETNPVSPKSNGFSPCLWQLYRIYTTVRIENQGHIYWIYIHIYSVCVYVHVYICLVVLNHFRVIKPILKSAKTWGGDGKGQYEGRYAHILVPMHTSPG